MTNDSFATREDLLKEIATREREYSELLTRVRSYQMTAHMLQERFDLLLKVVGGLEAPSTGPLPQEPIPEEIVRVYLEAAEALAEAGASAAQVRSILAADGCDTPECSVGGETFSPGLPIRDHFLTARREFGIESMERARDVVTSPAAFSVLHAAATASLQRRPPAVSSR